MPARLDAQRLAHAACRAVGGDHQARAQLQRPVAGLQMQVASAVLFRVQPGEAGRPVAHQARDPPQARLQRLAEVARHHHLSEGLASVVGRVEQHPAEVAGAADMDAADRAGRGLQGIQHAQRAQRVDRGLGQAQVALVEDGRQFPAGGGLDQGHIERKAVQGDRQAGADQAAPDDHDIVRSDHRHMIRAAMTAPWHGQAAAGPDTARLR